MKQILTKEDVANAIALIKSEGKRITLNTLHAALNHRGSMTTLMRLKSEIELEAQATSTPDSAEGLNAFREVWALAVEEGRKQKEAIISQLREDQKALAAENERLDGLVTARAEQAQQLLHVGTQLERELKIATASLLDATEQAKQALTKLTAEQSAHAEEVSGLRRELDSEARKSHELELELVRARAHLEAHGPKPVKA
jgi:hypothetical protein